MSLRAHIHNAVDEVAPPAPQLASRVVAFIDAGGRPRRAAIVRRRWAWGLSRGLSLTAAVMVVVLLVAVFAGGRLWRDWNSYRAQQALQSQLTPLEARPWSVPSIQAGAECPAGPIRQMPADAPGGARPMTGKGPLYAQTSSFDLYVTAWGTWTTTYYLADPKSAGLILVRSRDLVTGQTVLFADGPYEDVAHNDGHPHGTLVQSDAVQGQPIHGYDELLFDASQGTASGAKNGYFAAVVLIGYPGGASGCIGYQVDGPDFTETFVVATG